MDILISNPDRDRIMHSRLKRALIDAGYRQAHGYMLLAAWSPTQLYQLNTDHKRVADFGGSSLSRNSWDIETVLELGIDFIENCPRLEKIRDLANYPNVTKVVYKDRIITAGEAQ